MRQDARADRSASDDTQDAENKAHLPGRLHARDRPTRIGQHADDEADDEADERADDRWRHQPMQVRNLICFASCATSSKRMGLSVFVPYPLAALSAWRARETLSPS